MDAIRMLLENALESQQKEKPFDVEHFYNLYQEHHGDMMTLHHMKDAMSMFPSAREHMMTDYNNHLDRAAKSHADYHNYVSKHPKEVSNEGFPAKPHSFIDAIGHTENAWQAGQEAGNERQWDAEHEHYMDSHQ